MMAVPPLAAQIQAAIPFVKPCAPGDEFSDSGGRLTDDRVDDGFVTQACASHERVGDMVVEAILRIDHACDASLGPLAR